MSENKSYYDGLYGQAPSAGTDWNSFQQGKAIRDLNQAELSRQQAASSTSWDSPSQQSWQSTPTSGYRGSGSSGPVAGAGFIGSLFMFSFSFWLFPLLYPFTAAVVAGTAAGAYLLMLRVAPGSIGPLTGDALPSGLHVVLGVSLVVLWTVSRFDHTLARRAKAYRITRHVLRLALSGGLAWATGVGTGDTVLFPRAMQFLAPVFRSPGQLAVVLGTIAGMHLLLSRGDSAREQWHRMLEALRLRPRRFAPRKQRSKA